MQHALTHVERPGGSHEGVGRKKNFEMCSRGAKIRGVTKKNSLSSESLTTASNASLSDDCPRTTSLKASFLNLYS